MEDLPQLQLESRTRMELWAGHERHNRLQLRGDCNRPRPKSMRCVHCDDDDDNNDEIITITAA